MKRKSEKAKASAAANTDPARVGRLGYAGLREYYYKNKKKVLTQFPCLAKYKCERSVLYLYARMREEKETDTQESRDSLKKAADELVRIRGGTRIFFLRGQILG